MSHWSIYLLLVFLLSLQASGNHNDSVAIHHWLNQGTALLGKDPARADAWYRKAFAMADTVGFMDDSIAAALSRSASYSYYRGNTADAIEFALKAMNHYNGMENHKQAVQMMILVGDILRGNNLYDQSAQYLIKSKTLACTINDSTILAKSYNRLAALYFEDTRAPFDSCEKYALLSLGIARRTGNEQLLYNNMNILGALESKRGNYTRALAYFRKAYPLAVKVFPQDEPLVLINMARTYHWLNMTAISEKMSMKALALSQNMNIPQYIKLAALNLNEIYLKRGDYQNAYKYMTIYYQSKETVFSQKVEVQLQDFNNQLAIEKQHTENQKLLYEQQLAKNRLQIFRVVGAFLILLLVLLMLFLVFQHRQRQKIHRIAGQLDQSNTVLKRFISILAHDLRSPFNAILGFTDLLKNDTGLSPEERELAVDKLYTSSRSTFKLLESILEWSLVESGTIKPVFRECDMDELIRETILIQEPAASLKKIEIRYLSPGPLPIQADHDMVMATLRNILSNAVKFTNPGGLVKIGATASKQNVQVEISDNGIGIPSDHLKKLFRPDENYKSKGTAGEEGSGLGLTLCREYIGMHKGTLTVQSTLDKGSTFEISLPLKQGE